MFAFTKNNTQEVKGIAILCMIFFHLFGFPNRMPEGVALSWMGNEITKAFQICVPIYLFMAGYGLQCVANRLSMRNLLVRLKKLYFLYWWIAVPFILVGTLVHYYWPVNWRTLVLTLLGVTSRYNGEWWFYSLYVELLVLFYLFIGRLKFGKWPYMAFMLALLLFTRLLNSSIHFDDGIIWQRHIHMILIDVNIFVLGCFFAKFDAFAWLYNKFAKVLVSVPITIVFLVVPIWVRAYLPLIGITELLCVPMFVIGIVNMSKIIGGGDLPLPWKAFHEFMAHPFLFHLLLFKTSDVSDPQSDCNVAYRGGMFVDLLYRH